MNTTTCAHCGHDFPDGDMLPLEQGGELCGDCMEQVRDAAPELLAALTDLVECHEKGLGQFQMGRRAIAGRAAITKATGA